MATPNGLEPSTSSVTGWRSALLNYEAIYKSRGAVAHPTVNWLQMSESNRRLEAYEACDLAVCPICSIWWEELVSGQPIWIFSPAHIRLCHLPKLMVMPTGFEPAHIRMKTLCLNHLTTAPCWWARLDSNQRRINRRIYSPLPLPLGD